MTGPGASRASGARVRARPEHGQPDADLARTPADELLVAMQHLDDLLRAAHALLAAGGHDPDGGSCAGGGCLLAGVPDGAALCGLAQHLIGARPGPATSSPVVHAAAEHFRAALAGAMDAVRACRQTAHPHGACWFAPDPRVDGCAVVLRVAHEVC